MLSHLTLDQLKNLKLHGMARAFAELGDNPQAGEPRHKDPRVAARTGRRGSRAFFNGCKCHPAIAPAAEATGAVMEVTKWLKPSV